MARLLITLPDTVRFLQGQPQQQETQQQMVGLEAPLCQTWQALKKSFEDGGGQVADHAVRFLQAEK
jgi:hypothetical protein